MYRKKKLEEEEAEVKRKATDAAYQGKLDSCFFALQGMCFCSPEPLENIMSYDLFGVNCLPSGWKKEFIFSLQQNTKSSDKKTNSVERACVRGVRIRSECFIHSQFLGQCSEQPQQWWDVVNTQLLGK